MRRYRFGIGLGIGLNVRYVRGGEHNFNESQNLNFTLGIDLVFVWTRKVASPSTQKHKFAQRSYTLLVPWCAAQVL